MDGSTHACSVMPCGGGVGRNIAEALWRLRGGKVRLLTAIGDDADGKYLENIAPGLLLDGCVIKGGSTASYAAVLDSKGECLLGLGDMALHNNITVDLVNKHVGVLEQAPLIVIDGNIPQPTMNHILKLCNKMEKAVFFEPTDPRKAIKPLNTHLKLAYASPNILELHAMAKHLKPDIPFKVTEDIPDILELCKIVVQKVNFLILTLGSRGVLTVNYSKDEHTEARFYPVVSPISVENVSGAGDCFASGFINGTLSNYKQSLCITMGFHAAKCALLSHKTVPDSLNIQVIAKETRFTVLKII